MASAADLRPDASARLRVAAVQMSSGADREANLSAADAGIERAAAEGARLVVLPELFSCNGGRAVMVASAEPVDGPTAAWAAAQASAHGLWLVAGSFIEAADDGSRHNTCLVVAPDGTAAAAYRKVHLFDCDVPGAEYHESSLTAPGDELVVVPTTLGAPVGLSLCYDLRFPEQYRILALEGARILVVPAAFTAKTGPPHWEVLLRARAIENQCVVVAAGQAGHPAGTMAWHGHSMIVDPWGTVLAEAGGDEPRVIVADVDLAGIDVVRARLPNLAARRPTAYRWPT